MQNFSPSTLCTLCQFPQLYDIKQLAKKTTLCQPCANRPILTSIFGAFALTRKNNSI